MPTSTAATKPKAELHAPCRVCLFILPLSQLTHDAANNVYTCADPEECRIRQVTPRDEHDPSLVAPGTSPGEVEAFRRAVMRPPTPEQLQAEQNYRNEQAERSNSIAARCAALAAQIRGKVAEVIDEELRKAGVTQ